MKNRIKLILIISICILVFLISVNAQEKSKTFTPQKVQPIENSPNSFNADVSTHGSSDLPSDYNSRSNVEKITQNSSYEDIINIVVTNPNEVISFSGKEFDKQINLETGNQQINKDMFSDDEGLKINIAKKDDNQEIFSEVQFNCLNHMVIESGKMDDTSNCAVLVKYRSTQATGVAVRLSNSNIVTTAEVDNDGNMNFWINDDISQKHFEMRDIGKLLFFDNEWYYIFVTIDDTNNYQILVWQENNPENNTYSEYSLKNYVSVNEQRKGKYIYSDVSFYSFNNEAYLNIGEFAVYEFTDSGSESHTESFDYTYKDDYSKYQLAIELFNNEDYYNAYLLLNELNGYSTSNSYLEECERLLSTIQIDNDILGTKIKENLFLYGMPVYDYLYVFQAEKLRNLDLSYCKIEDLSFIENFPNLKQLNLDHNAISDLTPLKDLYSLEKLSLANNCISDTLPLYNLTNLEYLDLSSNVLYEVEDLGNLKSLKELYLSKNNLYSIAGLYNIENLEKVDLSYNFIDSVNALNHSPIKELDIINTDINNLSAVANLSELKVLRAGFVYFWQGNTERYLFTKKYENDDHFFMGISGLRSLTGHKNLKTLYLARLQEQSLEPLTTMPNLESLQFHRYQGGADYEAMAQLVGLKELTLDQYGVNSDTSFLSKLINLEKLSVETFCHIEDISIISGLSNLKELTLYRYTDNLDFITELKNLNRLELIGLEGFSPWPIESFSPLIEVDNLEHLTLDNIVVEDFSDISQIDSLKYLELKNGENEINSIQGVENLSDLEYFYMNYRQCSNLDNFDRSLFENLDNIKYVSVNVREGKNAIGYEIGELEDAEKYNGHSLGDDVFNREWFSYSNPECATDLQYYNWEQDLVIMFENSPYCNNVDKLKLHIPNNIRNAYVFSDTDNPIHIELDCAGHQGLERIVFGNINVAKDDDSGWGYGDFIIENLDGLNGCTNLREIYINNAEISDISGLENCERLEILHLIDNNITDISALKDKIYLKEIELSNNSIENKEVLESCIRLR